MNDVAEPQLRSAAEAILIVADEPVTTSAIAEALGLDERAAEELLDDLAAEYRGETPGSRPHGFLLRRAAVGANITQLGIKAMQRVAVLVKLP